MRPAGRLKNVLWVVGQAHMPRHVCTSSKKVSVAISPMAQSSARCYANHTAVPGLSSFLPSTGCNGAVRRLLSQKVEARVGDGYQKGQLDKSTVVAMEAPFGHDGNEALAQQLGIFKVYEYEDSGRISRVTVAFQSRHTNTLPAQVQTVAAHMALDNAQKLEQIPHGKVRTISLPDDVTTHFRDLKVPFVVEIFESNTEGVSDSLVFAFETPGGFWTIGWHVPVSLFTQEPDLFFLFLQTIRLSPTDLPDPKK